MLKLHILPHVSARGIPDGCLYICYRKLAKRDIARIRSLKLRRYFLPTLARQEQQDFFREFDAFWDTVVGGRGPESRFWRNGVASKMQEWENSAAYLAVVLFTLMTRPPEDGCELVVLPDSVEEAEVWQAWARVRGWTVVSYGFGIAQRAMQEAEHVLRAVRLAVLVGRRKMRAGSRVPRVRPGAFLIVTMFYRQALIAEKYTDLFFSTIHEDIARAGHDALYVGDAIDGLQPGDSARLGVPPRPASIYAFVSWSGLFAGLWTVFARPPRFQDCPFAGVDMGPLLSWQARRARYDFNLTAEFFYRAVREACQRFQFSKLLYVFEGNTYERAAVQAFRSETSSGVDAYSHAVLYALNLKLHASPSESGRAPEPNRYLVCGGLAREKLMDLRRTTTEMATACSLRDIPRPAPGKGRRERILVAMDGVWSTVSLLEWLCEHADVFDGRPVVIRPHPNVSGSRLWGQSSRDLPASFRVSERTLQEDLEDVACVVYRHSSVGVQALMHGIPIVHLQVDLPLPGDPLEGVSSTRLVADSPEGLREALVSAVSVDADISRDGDMVREYFAPPCPEGLGLFLDARPRLPNRSAGAEWRADSRI